MAAALAAVPLAGAGIRYGADLARSVVAQVADALRVPILGTETTTTRTMKRGVRTTTTKAAIPAWVAVSGLLVAAWWFSSSKPSSGGGFEWNPLTGIPGSLLPH